jgi:hypothetical protein
VPDVLRRRGPLLLRILVSAALLGVVLAYADLDEVASAVRGGEWGWFALALGVMGAATLVGALRWWLLLRTAEIGVSGRRAVQTFAASLFLNVVLPTSVGGDAARAWLVGRESGRLIRAATATIADKATSVGCLFLVAWAVLVFDRDQVPSSVLAVLFWVTLGLVAACGIAVAVAAGVRPVVRRLPERLAGTIREVWLTIRVWIRSAKLIGRVVGLGVVYQVLALFSLVLVAWTVGVDLSFPLAAVAAPIVIVATLMPISVGGLGVREGAFVLLLGEAGISGAEATVVSLLSVAVIAVAGVAVVLASTAYDVLVPGAKGRPVPRQPSP